MPPPEGAMCEQKIASITMERGIHPQIPTCEGGVGLLAGDVIRSGADLSLPLVEVTLASRHGYLRQEMEDGGRQSELPFGWDAWRLMEEAGCGSWSRSVIRPLFDRRRDEWIEVMNNAIGRSPTTSTPRMIRRYVTGAYLQAGRYNPGLR